VPDLRGEEIHGEHAAVAATGQVVVLYTQNQSVRTLASDEFLVITDIALSCSAQAVVTVFADKDGDNAVDAGERILAVAFGATQSPMSVSFHGTPFYCPVGTLVNVITTTGTVYLNFTGYILKA
jgi:hypothetical protein